MTVDPVMPPTEPGPDGLDPAMRRLLRGALRADVDVETAARHLWRIHREATAAPSEPVVPTAPAVVAAPRRRLVAALSMVIVLATSGVAGSRQALPGELLYPAKRGAERAQLLLALEPSADARLHLRFARARLGEAAAVNDVRPAWVPRLLADAVDAVDRAERLAGPEVTMEVAELRRATGVAVAAVAGGDPAIEEAIAEVAARLGMAVAATAPEPSPPAPIPAGPRPPSPPPEPQAPVPGPAPDEGQALVAADELRFPEPIPEPTPVPAPRPAPATASAQTPAPPPIPPTDPGPAGAPSPGGLPPAPPEVEGEVQPAAGGKHMPGLEDLAGWFDDR